MSRASPSRILAGQASSDKVQRYCWQDYTPGNSSSECLIQIVDCCRKDTNAKLPAFLEWTEHIVTQLDDLFLVSQPFTIVLLIQLTSILLQTIGTLQVLSELTKSAPSHQILPYIPKLFGITDAVNASTRLTSNTLLRKLRIKLVSRTLLRLMPAKRSIRRKGKYLH